MQTDRQTAAFAPERLSEPRDALERIIGADESVVLGENIVRWHRAMLYDARVDVKDEQRRRLQATIGWARKIRTILKPLLDAHGERVHFRPSSTGVAMVGLLHDRPQRGKSGIRDLPGLTRNFDMMFNAHCRDVDHGRVTGEKALQSFLIREAHKNNRRLGPINLASTKTDEPVALVFVTDEIPLPVAEGKKMVCDVLALRRDGGRTTPVLLELKDDRMLTRLVEQVEGYAALVDAHADLFAELFEALLGEEIRFDASTEKWIVWPAAGTSEDPREDELAARHIRVVGYASPSDGLYDVRVGRSGTRPA